jgi:hypothetical protein
VRREVEDGGEGKVGEREREASESSSPFLFVFQAFV